MCFTGFNINYVLNIHIHSILYIYELCHTYPFVLLVVLWGSVLHFYKTKCEV